MTSKRIGVVILAIAFLGYLGTGLSVIQQDEVGVVRRLGAVMPELWPPGLHLGLPRGLDRVDRLVRDQARTVSVGARGSESAPMSGSSDPASEDVLTGDLNLVTVRALVQFRVTKPIDYLFASASADLALSAIAESALLRAVAARSIDDVLTTSRAEVAEEIRQAVQLGSDSRHLGVSIRAVRLARVAPPDPVAPAFADASRARGDRRQVVTRAEEYRDRAMADARGLARETADLASARFDGLVQSAKGEADRFRLIAAEVRKAPDSARNRLYHEALGDLLPRFGRKLVVASGRDLDLNFLGVDESKAVDASPAEGRKAGSP